MKAREWWELVGGIVRGLVIAAAIAGVLAYVVEWLRLHRGAEPSSRTWAVVFAVGAVLLLVRIVDGVVSSVRQALRTRYTRKLEIAQAQGRAMTGSR